MKILNVVLMSIFIGNVYSMNPPVHYKNKKHPCLQLKIACEKAGYSVNSQDEKKKLYFDCLKPLIDGNNLSNVDIDPEDLQNCQKSPVIIDSYKTISNE